MSPRFRCALDAQARGETRFGTASHVRRWILLEQPGPWGRDALAESRLPAEVATSLRTRASELNARVILLRQPRGRSSTRRRCFVGASDRAWMEQLVVDDVRDLLDVDLHGLRAGDSVGGAPVDHPLHLVCTNGRHDACCAEYGQPLARALDTTFDEGVWECSHIGGDRFAGNLVCFPHGLYFGHVDGEAGPRVARGYEQGVIDLDHYRGRSCHPFVVQAAEYFLRVERDLPGVDDVEHLSLTALTPDTVRASFASRRGRYWGVDVRVRREDSGQVLTCRSSATGSPPRFDLQAIAELPAPASASG